MDTKFNFKKLWDWTTGILVAVVVAFAIFLMASRLLGMQVFNVISGSMEPKYSVGDLIYVKTVDPDAVQVGDDITFVLNEELMVATHQVIGVDAQKRLFYTKGLANATADAAPVHFNNLIGVPVFHIPLLGYVSDFIRRPPGLYIAGGFCVVLLAAVFLPDLVVKRKDESPAPSQSDEHSA